MENSTVDQLREKGIDVPMNTEENRKMVFRGYLHG